MPPVEQATREIYWNIQHVWLMYVLLVPTAAVMVYGVYRRYRAWSLGLPAARNDRPWARLKLVLTHAVAQARLARNRMAGFYHRAFSWAFVLLFLGTVVVMLQADFGLNIMHGRFYLYFQSVTLNVAGLFGIIGLVMAAYRRYVLKPRCLSTFPGAGPGRSKSVLDDWLLLDGFLIILVTGYVVSALRIAATDDPWGWYRFLAATLALPLQGADPAVLRAWHVGLWWFHMVLVFAWLAYLPYSKLFHIVSSPLSIYFQSLQPKGALAAIDLEAEVPRLGAAQLTDFNWKDLLDLDACTECGRCQEACPAFATGKALNPKLIILDLQQHLHAAGPALLQERRTNGKLPDSMELEASRLVGPVITPEALWACTTCYACVETCPVSIEHVPKIVDMRRAQVMMFGDFPPEANNALRGMERQGNPYGMGAHDRMKWAAGLQVKTLAENPDAEYLYWVGCAGSFDARSQKIARSVVQLLNTADVSFAILGNEEKCTGDPARRIGNEPLFQQLAMENVATLQGYNVKKVITHCPHCFNTIKNEYTQFGLAVEMVHHSQLLNHLVQSGRLLPRERVEKKVAYHDSCYLGRYNDIFAPPRELLQAVPGLELKEMGKHGRQAMCCGAGGGRMWMEETEGTRINAERTRQALQTQPDAIATNCPFCMTMMTDGVAAHERAEDVAVQDIAEILLASVQGNQEPQSAE